ncbi:HNH endonuclease [Ahrensia sp. R2A130]|uniref:HNH endonuclease n=1 Tax=Ahrensia sp. R2A130 TaxID=744979 RepID=UPI0001E0F13A|nr:HNH endonuclease [Ahrensia sp. R2A130]EFL87444.1 conserved hypothetical protein [Ahrensia sp. R2A130]
MISVKRTACPAALDPNDPTAAGPKELAKLKQKLVDGQKLKSDDFNAYSGKPVRNALEEMFHGKCAYCEGKVASTNDTDIEHYRPKKGVTEAGEHGFRHEGYWWLAMVWENLVLSCAHCNQIRAKHIIIPDHLVTVEELEAFLMDPQHSRAGKLNAFPTADNKWVISPEEDHNTEKPLIINPVDMDPDEHLDWVLHNGASLVRAKNGSAAGEATRTILGLNRRWLEEERRIMLMEMILDREEIIEGVNGWLEATNEEAKTLNMRQANHGIRRLQNRTLPHKQFAGLAKAFFISVRDEVASMQAAV